MKVDNPTTEIQVFAAVFEDGRKKPRMYLLKGEDKEKALSKEYEVRDRKPIRVRQESDTTELKHLGSWEKFEREAENYHFDWHSGFSIPKELIDQVGHSQIHQARDKARPKVEQKYTQAKA